MKIRHFFVLSMILFAAAAHADELTKQVQTELKDQGFYYSEVTGVNGPDTVAAVKRYQIRNGLEVTGTFTKETLQALGIEGGGSAPALSAPRAPQTAPAPAPQVEREPSTQTRPPVNLRREETVEDTDRDFLRRATPGNSPIAPEEDDYDAPPAAAGGGYASIFSRTPYATAPAEVQQDTIARAQRLLAQQGLYRAGVDGVPGPATEEALLGFQRMRRLPLTGRLDLETLSEMRLLPGRGGAPAARMPARPQQPTGSSRVYRGIWVD